MLRMAMVLLLAACTPNDLVIDPGGDEPMDLGDMLASQPMPAPTVFMARLEDSAAIAEPIYEIQQHPASGPVSTSTVEDPPLVTVRLLPQRGDESATLTIWLTTGGVGGIPNRNAWLVVSPFLFEDPINWGTTEYPVLQMIPFDIVLPFPPFRITDYGVDDKLHRQPTSGIVEVQGEIRLTAPMYLQLIVEAPEENPLGYVVTKAIALIPGGQ